MSLRHEKKGYAPSVIFIATGLTVAVVMLTLEVFFYFFDSRHSYLFRQEPWAVEVNSVEVDKFLSSTFDPELGKDTRPIARNFETGQSYLAISFGDSFTLGHEVDDDETWQAAFEQMTGMPILNMGVGGYGIDQAVLKFEKYASTYPAPHCILNVNSEMYRRALAYHMAYYFKKGWFYSFKPIFIRNNGRYELREVPCTTSECLIGVLREPPDELVQFLEVWDYWYQKNQQKPILRFPYTVSFIRAIPIWIRDKGEYYGFYDNYFMNEHAFKLTKYLINRFVDGCERLGAEPLVLILNSPGRLNRIRDTGKRWDRPLLMFLADANIPFVDSTRFIMEKYSSKDGFDFDSLKMPQGHFNADGNRLIAESLAEHFADQNESTLSRENVSRKDK